MTFLAVLFWSIFEPLLRKYVARIALIFLLAWKCSRESVYDTFFSNFWQVWIRLVTVVTLGCMMTKMTPCLVARPWWQTRRDLRYWKSLRFKLTIGSYNESFKMKGDVLKWEPKNLKHGWIIQRERITTIGIIVPVYYRDARALIGRGLCHVSLTCELITTGAQNFKMAALHLVNNSVGMITW